MTEKLREYFDDMVVLHSRIRQTFYGHSHHRYFVDLRHIGYTIHRWTAFVAVFTQPQDGSSLPTSPSF